jgi:predicted  nucleic acid-binding Zn-ribbon protein
VQIPSHPSYGSNLTDTAPAAPTRIGALQARIKLLLKKIEALGESMKEATQPKMRKAIMQEIMLMQQQISLIQAQIAELQKRSSQKMRARAEPPTEPKESWVDAYGP